MRQAGREASSKAVATIRAYLVRQLRMPCTCKWTLAHNTTVSALHHLRLIFHQVYMPHCDWFPAVDNLEGNICIFYIHFVFYVAFGERFPRGGGAIMDYSTLVRMLVGLCACPVKGVRCRDPAQARFTTFHCWTHAASFRSDTLA